MSYTIERLNNHPALVICMNDDFQIPDDIIAYTREAGELLEHEDEPVTVIADLLNYTLSVNDLLSSTKLSMNEEHNLGKHAKVKKVILVTESTLLKKSLDGFGKLGVMNDVQAVKSIEEALALI